ncbi:MAG: hypothetical protein JOZ93_15195 [Sinobacteraceae bacterium]|nr:hypothetical protein [Nevskiaceae bacterium]
MPLAKTTLFAGGNAPMSAEIAVGIALKRSRQKPRLLPANHRAMSAESADRRLSANKIS